MNPQVVVVTEKAEKILGTEGVQMLLKIIAEEKVVKTLEEKLQMMIEQHDLAIMRKDKTKIQGVKCTLWVVTLVSEQLNNTQ